MEKQQTIVVKIGSSVVTRKNGTLDVTRISSLVDQVSALSEMNIKTILVSSGAVASGRTALTPKQKLDTVSSRQLYSSIGQAKLIYRYYDLFRQHGLLCGQVLATKEDFSTRRHYLNQRNCMRVMLENNVIPIVNENDTISVNELMFTDNDELSGLIATMMDCDKLIILSNIDGIYNGNPKDPSSSVVRSIDPKKDNVEDFIQTSKSSTGRGGMQTKYGIARKVAEEGIEVVIANGERDNILVDLFTGKDTVCTRFLPSPKDISSVKKWIAHSDGFAKGEIHINAGAVNALLSEKAISLLPIGIINVVGDFEEDDIIRIIDESGTQIGVGRTAFDSIQTRLIMGKTREKPVVHYNYLYIENKNG